MTVRKRAQLKNRVANVQAKMERLRSKHGKWNPADANTIASWQKAIETARQQIEFASHPLIERMMKHHTQAVKDIDYILLNDKALPSDERRVIMEKKEMYQSEIRIFMIDEKVVEFLEKQATSNLEPKTESPASYSHDRLSGLPYMR